jgi:hypothetical protein
MLRKSSNLPKSTYLNYPHFDEVEAFLEGIKALKPKLVLLFGSVAKGDFTQYSDADVLVLFERPIDWLEVYQFSKGMVHPMVKTLQEVELRIHGGDTFFIEILRDGMVLFEEEGTYQKLLALAKEAERQYGLVRTEKGWRWSRPTVEEVGEQHGT